MSDNTNNENKTYSNDFSNDDNFPEIPDVPSETPVIPEDEYTYKSRKETKKVKTGKEHSDKKNLKFLYAVIPAALIIVLFAAFLSLPLFLPKNAIASNVWSGNINLSKLTVNEAQNVILGNYNAENVDFSVTFTHEGKIKRTSFSSANIEYTADSAKTAQAAYNIGRSGNIFANSWNVLRSFFAPVDVGMIPSCNEDNLSEIFYSLGTQVYGEGEDTKCVIENGILTITPSTPGQSRDLSQAISEFLTSVQQGKYHDIPITLNSNESDKLDADQLYKKLCVEPKNAEYKINENQVTITDHVVGIDIDKAKLAALVEQVNNGSAGSIEVIYKNPEITKEQLQQSLFGTTLATFNSSYKSSSANRAYNVELAASKVNGVILANGAEFSYNDVVGNANAANGFKMATVYSGGKVTEGVGGGVCQVSSTLYCAVLRSDLEVTERHNHSLPISYVPGGQDATVAYDILDFRFKNNTGAPIKIVASCSNRTVTVSILGAASAKKNVEVISQKTSSIAPTMTEIQDPTLPTGQTKVISNGQYGSVYVTYKRVYDANGAMVSETKTTSRYKATPGEIAVGTAPVPTQPAVPETPAVPNEPTVSTTPAEQAPPSSSGQTSEQPPAEAAPPSTDAPVSIPDSTAATSTDSAEIPFANNE